MDPLALRAPIQESGPLESLMELHTRVLWRTLSSGTGHYALSLADFTKRQRPLRMDAFEQYARGLQAADPEAKLAHLHEAARLEPEWLDPIFALGEAYFSKKDYNAALAWFFKIPKTYDRYGEALFFSGVCRLQSNQADLAEQAFHTLQETLKRSEEHTSELQSRLHLACRLLLEKKNTARRLRLDLPNNARAKADHLLPEPTFNNSVIILHPRTARLAKL